MTFTATGVRLLDSEGADNGLRIVVDSAASDLAVTLAGVPEPNRVVTVCPAPAFDHHVAAPGCAMPASGATVLVPHGADYAGVEIALAGVTGPGPAGSALTLSSITVAYIPSSRQVRLRLPPMPNRDTGGTPDFRLSPAGPGTYRALATWAPSATGTSGEAELVLATGSSDVSRSQGGPDLQVSGNLSPPAEADVGFHNTGSVALLAPTLTVLFP